MQPRAIVWIRPATQGDDNSASEVGREYLANRHYDIVVAPSSPMAWLRLLLALRRGGEALYFQISDPVTNACVCLLRLLSRSHLSVHYLDHVIGGYPAWARLVGLHIPIEILLRRADTVVTISPPMHRYVRSLRSPDSETKIYFRVIPDSQMARDDAPLTHPKAVCFIGSINRKTNLSALLDATAILADRGLELHIFTRTRDAAVIRELRQAGAHLDGALEARDVVRVASGFLGQLLPFNHDARSRRFYCLSNPSKLPNVIAARRPILYFGPREFWLFAFLRDYPGFIVLDGGFSPDFIPVAPTRLEDASTMMRNIKSMLRA